MHKKVLAKTQIECQFDTGLTMSQWDQVKLNQGNAVDWPYWPILPKINFVDLSNIESLMNLKKNIHVKNLTEQ